MIMLYLNKTFREVVVEVLTLIVMRSSVILYSSLKVNQQTTRLHTEGRILNLGNNFFQIYFSLYGAAG
jgi:uncharacterized membrane protein